ncbi:MAG: ferritin [Spirochaetia bacterium]|jgi:ferritin-like protein|nr:ferritin [Spirochaetia bacterium]
MYLEPATELSQKDRDIIRGLKSLIEEIEAVDYYHQRVATTEDNELKALVAHNRDEELEHAAMLIEWLRRKLPAFDKELHEYLFTEGSLLKIEMEGK